MKATKTILILAILAITFSSCKKCYQCTLNITYSPNTIGGSISTFEFCGTKSEMEATVKAGTLTSTATSGGVTVTTTQKTTCR